MSAEVKNENQPYDDINVTPMLDLAYVLLVVFIILTTASVQGIKVNVPLTMAAQNLARPQTRAVTVTRDGAVYLDAYPVTMEELETRMAQYKAGNPAPGATVWVRDAFGGTKTVTVGGRGCGTYSDAVKRAGVVRLYSRQETAQTLAEKFGVSRPTLYNWKNQLLGPEAPATLKRKNTAPSGCNHPIGTACLSLGL